MNNTGKIFLDKIMKKDSKNSLFLLIPYLKDYKIKIFFVIIALLTTSIMVLFMGKIIKYLIDFGFSANNLQYLNFILLAFAVIVIILAVAGYFRSSLINEVGERVVAKLRQRVYSHIILSSNDFFEQTKIGDIISRLTIDTTLLYNIISNSISFLLRNILLFVGGLVFLFLSSVKLSLVSLILLPIAVIPIIFLGKKVKKLSLKTQEMVSLLTCHIEESINGIRTIKAYQNEEKNSIDFNNLSINALNSAIRKIQVRSLLISIVIAIAFGFVGVVIWFGSLEVIKGNMSAGSLSSFIFYAIITATSLVSISQVMGQLQTAAGAATRIFDLLKRKNNVIQAKNTIKITDSIKNKIEIEFKNVDFSYNSQKNIAALKNFNLKINQNDKIALIGPSGSGKSTVFQILLRFFDVNDGQILINNKINIKDLAIKDLRSLFSYISQDCFIFSGTIFENISYGNKNIDKNKVQKLIDDNLAFNFINKLPDKLDSFVGQKGIKLSGGERQRIAILRAMANDAAILLLDEATSALDNKNEQLIIDLINNISKDKIVIFIAHRLSTIKAMDRVVFIKDGEVIKDYKSSDEIDLNVLF